MTPLPGEVAEVPGADSGLNQLALYATSDVESLDATKTVIASTCLRGLHRPDARQATIDIIDDGMRQET